MAHAPPPRPRKRATSPDTDGLSRMLDAYLPLADSRKYNNPNLYEGRLHCLPRHRPPGT
jgi:hypothetical protein